MKSAVFYSWANSEQLAELALNTHQGGKKGRILVLNFYDLKQPSHCEVLWVWKESHIWEFQWSVCVIFHALPSVWLLSFSSSTATTLSSFHTNLCGKKKKNNYSSYCPACKKQPLHWRCGFFRTQKQVDWIASLPRQGWRRNNELGNNKSTLSWGQERKEGRKEENWKEKKKQLEESKRKAERNKIYNIVYIQHIIV